MRTHQRGILALATIAVGALVALVGVTPASAAPPRVSAETIEQAISYTTTTSSTWDIATDGDTAALMSKYDELLVPASGLKLAPEKAVSWTVDVSTTLLRVPVHEGQGAVQPSAIALIIDANTGSVISTVETVFTPHSETSGQVQAWVDGDLKVDGVVSAPEGEPTSADGVATYQPLGGSVQPMATPGSGAWWSALNTCLAAMGIPAWILAGLSIVCGVACVAAFTPPGLVACALCIAAASGFAVGVVTTCVNYANNA